jgi:peptidoglycan/xylan/chitin deacetylase (PgdA/CDA1 family)
MATPIFLDELMASQWPARKKNQRIAITFDDGYGDNYQYAFPLIKKMGVPVTLFINSDWIGTRQRRLCDRLQRCVELGTLERGELVEVAWRIHSLHIEEQELLLTERWAYPMVEELEQDHEDQALTVAQIQEMQESGLVRFEAHGHRHLSYGAMALKTIEQDLQQNMEKITAWTGRSPVGLAYPYGQPADVQAGLEPLLESLGLQWAVLASGQRNTPYTQPYALDRESPRGFATI